MIATAQGRQDSNLQPAVLETAALPIAPLPFERDARGPLKSLADLVIQMFSNTEEQVYSKNVLIVEPRCSRTKSRSFLQPRTDC